MAGNSSAGNSSTASGAPPGAYKMPGQSKANQQRFYITIPRGVRVGQHFAVLVNGQQMMVRCPEGNRPGDRLIVTSPRTQVQQHVMTVPPNVKAGDQFRVMIQNQEIMVRILRRSLDLYLRLHSILYRIVLYLLVLVIPTRQVTCPRGVKPGKRLTLLPASEDQVAAAACPQPSDVRSHRARR